MIEKYDGPERRSEEIWDRRIPNMPSGFGHFIRFIFKTKKRFWFLFFLSCIGWIGMISLISINLYKYFSFPSGGFYG